MVLSLTISGAAPVRQRESSTTLIPKERYYEAAKRFCRFLADHYRLQKLANFNGKHLTAYVLDMQERGKSASTIKTDLAAVRFFHDKMERTLTMYPPTSQSSGSSSTFIRCGLRFRMKILHTP